MADHRPTFYHVCVWYMHVEMTTIWKPPKTQQKNKPKRNSNEWKFTLYNDFVYFFRSLFLNSWFWFVKKKNEKNAGRNMKKTKTKSYAIHGWWLQMVVVNFSFLFFDHSFSTTLMMMIIIIIIVACLLLYNNDYIRLWVCTIWNLWSFSFFFTDVIYFNIFSLCVIPFNWI